MKMTSLCECRLHTTLKNQQNHHFAKSIEHLCRTVGMFVWKHTFLILPLAGGLSACSPKTTPCASSQVAIEDTSAIDSRLKAAPLGGFIHIGPRACTTTLSLVSANESTLVVNAYSALHCFREDKIQKEKVSLSVWIPASTGRTGGYLSKIPARDEFFERRAEFMIEIEKLDKPFLNERLRDIMQIELPYFFEDKEQVRKNVNDGDSEKLLRNICLSATEDKLNVPKSQHTCWSALDTGVRKLEIRAVDIDPARFVALRRSLESHAAKLQNLLRSDSQMAKTYQLWSNRIQGLTGLWRLTNYSPWAYFLNKNMCAMITPDMPESALCAARDKIITISKKYMVEIDADGTQKNIFQKADELGFGLNQNLMSESSIELVNLMPRKAFDKFHEVFQSFRTDLKQRIRTQNDQMMSLPPEYVIAANPFVAGASGKTSIAGFSLLKGSVLIPEGVQVPSKGMSSKGTLRFYVNSSKADAVFGKTDSGAMITYAGVVPLLVLNSVDDEPTSGGASILALPEAQPEDVRSSSLGQVCQ